ncbi:MAG: dUTP diphosphatase [Bacteroidetes bacterium]|nr:dUTP diphosphatase [Bacteroidota bacterium]
MEVQVINTSNNPLPVYQTIDSSGLDLMAYLSDKETLKPLERKLIPTGLFLKLAQGTEAQIRPRSGLALKHGITVLNSPGTIDADYRGEVKVLLINLSNTDFEINNGDRIAQMIVSRYEKIEFKLVTELETTERGSGGYGSTGNR